MSSRARARSFNTINPVTFLNHSGAGSASGVASGAAVGTSSGGTVVAFPKSMTDPMFTGMTEQSDTLNLSASTTYTKQSWLDYSGEEWSILMANNVTVSKTRMRTREGPRYRGYTNTTFDQLYVEVYGLPGDHADGIQWEGGANTNVVIKNSHLRGLDGSHATFFASDGSTGTITIQNTLFTNDGSSGGCQAALKLFADAGFGTIKLSMKDCYIQQTGWVGPATDGFNINNTSGTSAVDVLLWDNVRFCSWNHATGVLTPGALIPQPSGT